MSQFVTREDLYLKAFAFETVTIASASAVTSFTSLTHSPAGDHQPVRKAQVWVDSVNAILYRIDGGTASSTSGHQVAASSTFFVYGKDQIDNFSVLSATSGTAAGITVTYFR